MIAKLIHNTGNVTAYCPDCGAMANFEKVGNSLTTYQQEVVYTFHKCTNCLRGAVAQMNNSILASFFPYARKELNLPPDVPTDLTTEFREAELCISFSAYRAASALLRSTLEKTLKTNGYLEVGKKGYDV